LPRKKKTFDAGKEVRAIARERVGSGMGNVSRPLAIEGIRRFAKALPDGVPGLPSAQGIKNLMEFDVKLPLKIKEDVAPEKVMSLKLMREVKEELESKR